MQLAVFFGRTTIHHNLLIQYLNSVLVGLLAGSDTENRAVLTGLRNFVRDLGGASGTTGR